MFEGITTEWGYEDGQFDEAKQEIFEVINKYQISLSDIRGLLNRVLLEIEKKNIVTM